MTAKADHQKPCRDCQIFFRPFLKNKKIRQAVLKIVVEEIEAGLIECSTNYPNARAGGVSFFQQFGSSLNFHPHFHLCFTDGVFLQEAGRLTFCQSNMSPDDIQDIEDKIRKRVLKLFGRRGWIEKEEVALRFSQKAKGGSAMVFSTGTLFNISSVDSRYLTPHILIATERGNLICS